MSEEILLELFGHAFDRVRGLLQISSMGFKAFFKKLKYNYM